jgi:hypothetical protein
MALTFAPSPAIKAGISRSPWDGLWRKAEQRVSLPVRLNARRFSASQKLDRIFTKKPAVELKRKT